MDALNTLRLLSTQTTFESAEDANCSQPSNNNRDSIAVSSAQLPNGRRITLLKTLLTSACERNCYYCPFRAGRTTQRATITPDDMASVYMTMHRAGIVEGLFLSSGLLNGGARTQDKLIATAEILRDKYQYSDYIHLKIMPGAEYAQVEQALRLADRVSINLEAPNDHRLALLAPRKQFVNELIQPMRWVDSIRRNNTSRNTWNGRWPSMTTQYVVGVVGESDLELLKTTAYLNKTVRLARAYFSAFRPVNNTPFEIYPATQSIRQQRLYQASYLLRDYGFSMEEIPFENQGYLPLDMDPKTAWAQSNLTHEPLEINSADQHKLLRIPGIGIKSATAIIKARKVKKICHPEELNKIGVSPKRAIPYILMDGKRPAVQKTFW